MIYLLLSLYVNASLIDVKKPFTCVKKKSLNESCSANYECLTDVCRRKICSRKPMLGESCEPSTLCADGLGCSNWYDGKCVHSAREGEKCQLSKNGLYHCDEGFLCYDGTCRSALPEGSKCSDDGLCGGGLACITDSVTKEKSCELKRKKNDACEKSIQCEDGMFCNRKNKCAYLKGMFNLCRDGSCKEGLYCPSRLLKAKDQILSSVKNVAKSILFPRLCRKLPKEGDACSDQCATDYYCLRTFQVKLE
jgi:hypothetical protein